MRRRSVDPGLIREAIVENGPQQTLAVGGAKICFERETGAALWPPHSWHHAVPCHRHAGCWRQTDQCKERK